ncbi:hypothetical protein MMA32_24150, partial [Salmonella enterica]|nr:hypothetical protein [Salmonella enterica]
VTEAPRSEVAVEESEPDQFRGCDEPEGLLSGDRAMEVLDEPAVAFKPLGVDAVDRQLSCAVPSGRVVDQPRDDIQSAYDFRFRK